MRILPAACISPIILFFLIVGPTAIAQYKNDNVAFKTVYMEEFCKQFKSNQKAVLLDVRSLGEYEDTSSAVGLNIGRLKATAHIDIQELPARWRELAQYKDQPVYVYCSHSQRSRRASKLLTDSGFTNIININGGLTTFNLLEIQKQCPDLYESGNQYKLISPLDVCSFLSKEKNVFLMDVRSDSAFKGISTDERQNAYGKFIGAVNIPVGQLSSSANIIPKDRPILIISDFSVFGATAAKTLVSDGFKNVNVLFNGLDALIATDKKDIGCLSKYWQQNIAYKVITPVEFDELTKKQTNLQIVDVRPSEEFNNQSKTAWRNIGILKNAINIPVADMNSKWNTLDKSKPVILYHFSGQDPFNAARVLTNQGFTKVYVLAPGLFGLRWQAANLTGKSNLKDWVVNVPEENR